MEGGGALQFRMFFIFLQVTPLLKVLL
jgi:hypothetical protein